MRILKKFIRKIYHFICFLCLFLLFCPNVNGAVNIDGANFVQSSSVDFADNTNGHLTPVGFTWVETGSYWRSGSSLYTTGGNYGANVAFLSDIPFVQGHTYSVSFLVGFANGYAITNNASNSRVCIAENTSSAFARYNNSSFPCTTAWSSSTQTNYYFSDGQIAPLFTMLSFVFTAEYTSNAITFTYTSSTPNESNHIFGGYIVKEISTQPLTQSQIQSAIQSSGLATANSVQQVQQGINQVQEQLSDVEGAVNDVNDTLNDSSVDSSDNTINNLKNRIPTNSVISNLLLLPVRFLQNFVNSLGSSCSNFSLGSLYGTNLIMPCIDLQSYLGSTIWTFIDLVFSGMFVLAIRKKFIQIYQNITNLKNGGNEVD